MFISKCPLRYQNNTLPTLRWRTGKQLVLVVLLVWFQFETCWNYLGRGTSIGKVLCQTVGNFLIDNRCGSAQLLLALLSLGRQSWLCKGANCIYPRIKSVSSILPWFPFPLVPAFRFLPCFPTLASLKGLWFKISKSRSLSQQLKTKNKLKSNNCVLEKI